MSHRPIPPIHAVTDDDALDWPAFEWNARELLEECGPDVAVHIRGPETSGERMYEVAAKLTRIARDTGSLIIVNDRLDIALATRAGGVQLGRRSFTIPDARRLIGRETRIGASVHRVDEAREAVDAGADWLVAGSVYATGSHPGQPGAGPGLIEAMAALGRPVIGIGGITPERVREVRDAGAAAVAAIRGIWDQPLPWKAARAYIEAWQS
jgi:thiamine-phosphate pyrophosphorylase